MDAGSFLVRLRWCGRDTGTGMPGRVPRVTSPSSSCAFGVYASPSQLPRLPKHRHALYLVPRTTQRRSTPATASNPRYRVEPPAQAWSRRPDGTSRAARV